MVMISGCGRIAFDAVPDRTDAGVASDAESLFDASAVCGALPFNDGFDDGTPGPAWRQEADPGVLVNELDSRLAVTLPVTAGSFGAYISTCLTDNRNRKVSVSIGDVPNSAPGVQMYVVIRIDNQNTIGIQFQDGVVFAFRRVGDVYSDVDTVPYDPFAHRYWRVGGQAGEVIWELSPDGVTWDERAREPAPFDLSATGYTLAVGNYMGDANPGAGEFDGFAVR